MTNINYVHDFLEKLKNHTPTVEQKQQSLVSNRVIELADQIKAWHDTRPIPDRWQPVQLGRIAAQLNASRELTATALMYVGWIEKRVGAQKLWQPK